ncbi:hypothetical protein [Anaerotalea alkaliphila]|uniref:Multicomponent Na+:H+ antiporter subunit B n=1 Tax=Anaerotalea alkaliphila TaxID=2662126 RepID=A0A7X5HVH6_9FIRM|nr:hypothetical protein [Anaerotalea alkaliphila]NDL67422.1 hypothetical protein [Anaerotalea alkaliphila]
MRRALMVLWAALLLVLFMVVYGGLDQVLPNTLQEQYVANFQEDTGARNAVTGIYLDYRVFDTLFEALMLLVSVIGIIHFSVHEGEGGDRHG